MRKSSTFKPKYPPIFLLFAGVAALGVGVIYMTGVVVSASCEAAYDGLHKVYKSR